MTLWYRLAIAASVLLAIFNAGRSVLSFEAVYRSGSEFYLAMRPVDPRSLMQGDFMALAYKEDFAERSKDSAPNQAEEGSTLKRWAIFRLDERRIGSLDRYATRRPDLGAGEVALRVDDRGSRALIEPRSYFFQEGQAKTFENARFVAFRYQDPALPLLYGLANEDIELLSHK